MQVRELETAPPRVGQPPRAMAWVVLLASAGAVFLTGLVGTALIFGSSIDWPDRTPLDFWTAICWSAALTIVSLALRSLRWVFLLRRAETRIPIRDAYIGYFAGLSLLFAPLLLGEIAVRAWIQRRRGSVPVLATTVVNVWERAVDLAALGVIAGVTGLWTGQATTWDLVLLAGGALAFVTPIRRAALHALVRLAAAFTASFDRAATMRAMTDGRFDRLAATRTWSVAWATGVAAWLLPGVGLWALVRAWHHPFEVVQAEQVFSASTILGAVTLAPGGVLVAGRELMASLVAAGLSSQLAPLTVLCARLATAGVSIALGSLFVVIHLRSAHAASASHFDDIAAAYDVQIPENRRLELLDRKTSMMRGSIEQQGVGSRGLDVGCGQGAYVARMRELGFDVMGIDQSEGQIRLAATKVGDAGVVKIGSVLEIPERDGALDFVYTINVLHHLPSIADQRRAFVELLRVLKPGGILFVHEINTRNVLFRFYMGYVFPSLNCIDEGVERWLLAERLAEYTDAPVVDVRYFTFLPDFVPAAAVRILKPLERLLERSRLRVYSAHYMAVVRKRA